ncbi:hypothetical protein [Shimia sagamensis]|uniref:Uncharacterized protein n=1 Tax=Shimia sagamensis TaxID=1566352 RepID=A0ABY1P3F8_9RHOB|nr:hypothetical protein [Shimia sagamensis]SMP23896.1 hypothetical protein SAMN06265373_104463 [Shimia sagamensis]
MTFKDGVQIAISGSAGNSKFGIGTRDGDKIYARENSIYYTADADSHDDGAAAYLSNPDSTDLEHMSYGAWIDADSNSSGSIAAGTYGAATPEAVMPSSGSATYTG